MSEEKEFFVLVEEGSFSFFENSLVQDGRFTVFWVGNWYFYDSRFFSSGIVSKEDYLQKFDQSRDKVALLKICISRSNQYHFYLEFLDKAKIEGKGKLIYKLRIESFPGVVIKKEKIIYQQEMRNDYEIPLGIIRLVIPE